MTVPIDRLYHYLESLSGQDIIIYRFYPYGSKKITDLVPMTSFDKLPWQKLFRLPFIIYNDQEPLNFNLYDNIDVSYLDQIERVSPEFIPLKIIRQLPRLLKTQMKECLNLRWCDPAFGLFDKTLLCHSEQRSIQVNLYEQSDFICIYYWCHALLAHDWFRYAKVDPELNKPKQNNSYDFLIYNRAWANTREYRLKFAELLLEHDIKSFCNIKFNPIDDKVKYQDYIFKNPQWQIYTQLESYYELNTHESCASADYNNTDYQNSQIEVVLETLFDDTRLHLTEKTLRPIACGQPFILMATHGSLEYLKRYGFETFNGLIDESYDCITDPQQRMHAVINEMKRISILPINDKLNLFSSIRDIAKRNQTRFFSDKFFDQVVQEYKDNFKKAMIICNQHSSGNKSKNYRLLVAKLYPEFKDRLMKFEIPGFEVFK